MKSDVKQKWVAALRSGEYQQGRNQLRDGNKYCCLGVLCDLYNEETGKGKWVHNSFNEFRNVPPPEVEQWASLGVKDRWKVSDANDGAPKTEPKTFDEIANLIEAQL